jgi:hypothetical protein
MRLFSSMPLCPSLSTPTVQGAAGPRGLSPPMRSFSGAPSVISSSTQWLLWIVRQLFGLAFWLFSSTVVLGSCVKDERVGPPVPKANSQPLATSCALPATLSRKYTTKTKRFPISLAQVFASPMPRYCVREQMFLLKLPLQILLCWLMIPAHSIALSSNALALACLIRPRAQRMSELSIFIKLCISSHTQRHKPACASMTASKHGAIGLTFGARRSRSQGPSRKILF